jgi:hypothetical protein
MPMQRDRYPINREEISRRIRFERAGNRCEWCGVENGILIIRSSIDPARYIVFDGDGYRHADGSPMRLSEVPDEFSGKDTRIVLTVAHLGTPHPDGRPGDKHDKMDCREENLAALCQRCHLNYDRDEHIENARRTRLEKKRVAAEATGQKSFW